MDKNTIEKYNHLLKNTFIQLATKDKNLQEKMKSDILKDKLSKVITKLYSLEQYNPNDEKIIKNIKKDIELLAKNNKRIVALSTKNNIIFQSILIKLEPIISIGKKQSLSSILDDLNSITKEDL